MKVPHRLSLLLSLVLVVGTSRSAAAAEDPEALIRQGVQMRRDGNDTAAYGYFKRAYEIARTPRTSAQLGLVEHSLARYLDAEAHLTDALASADDPWVAKNRGAIEKTRSDARKKLGRIDLRGAPAEATIAIGPHAAVPAPASGTIWVDPGEINLTVSAAGYEADTRTVRVAAGASATVELALRAKPAEATPPIAVPPPVQVVVPPPIVEGTPPPPANRRARIVGIVTASAGLAVGITGFALYRVGASKLDAIKGDAASKPYDPANGNYQTFGDTGIALMVAGGAAVAAGSIWYALHRSDGPSSTEVAFGYAPGAGGHLQLGWRF